MHQTFKEGFLKHKIPIMNHWTHMQILEARK
jgi:hypothetical protein